MSTHHFGLKKLINSLNKTEQISNHTLNSVYQKIHSDVDNDVTAK